MVIPEVVYPPEVDAPTPPRNLASILQALENGDSDLSAHEYEEDASREEADVEIHPAEENHDDDLTMDAAVENVVPMNRSCEASSGEPSLLVKTLEVIQKNQADLDSRMEKQDEINDEFCSFMVKQSESNAGIHDMLAKIMSKLGQRSLLCLSCLFLSASALCIYLLIPCVF